MTRRLPTQFQLQFFVVCSLRSLDLLLNNQKVSFEFIKSIRFSSSNSIKPQNHFETLSPVASCLKLWSKKRDEKCYFIECWIIVWKILPIFSSITTLRSDNERTRNCKRTKQKMIDRNANCVGFVVFDAIVNSFDFSWYFFFPSQFHSFDRSTYCLWRDQTNVIEGEENGKTNHRENKSENDFNSIEAKWID